MDSKEIEKVLIKWFKLKPKYCDIEIAGQILGGRHGECLQDPVSFIIAKDILRINFHTYEMLTITKPDGVRLMENYALVVRSAEEVRFGHYSYGDKIKSDNWLEHIYQVKEGYIQYRMIPDREWVEETIEFDGKYLVYISFPKI